MSESSCVKRLKQQLQQRSPGRTPRTVTIECEHGRCEARLEKVRDADQDFGWQPVASLAELPALLALANNDFHIQPLQPGQQTDASGVVIRGAVRAGVAVHS